jgi:hypothetical protein
LLHERKIARPPFDPLAIAASMFKLGKRMEIASCAARRAEGYETRADDDLACKSCGAVGLNLAVKHHRRRLTLYAFDAMINAVLYLAFEAIGVTRIPAEVRTGPFGLPGTVKRLYRRRAGADQVREPKLRFLRMDACRKS